MIYKSYHIETPWNLWHLINSEFVDIWTTMIFLYFWNSGINWWRFAAYIIWLLNENDESLPIRTKTVWCSLSIPFVYCIYFYVDLILFDKDKAVKFASNLKMKNGFILDFSINYKNIYSSSKFLYQYFIKDIVSNLWVYQS